MISYTTQIQFQLPQLRPGKQSMIVQKFRKHSTIKEAFLARQIVTVEVSREATKEAYNTIYVPTICVPPTTKSLKNF